MPFACNKGVDIYYEVHGSGSPLVLLHGFTAQSSQWKAYGYAGELQRSHQLILIDLRGHGHSAKPHERDAYRLQERLADIIAVLREVSVGRAHFCGYSMGGWLAFGMALCYPEMVASLIVGGAHPYEEKFDAFHGVDGSDPDAFIAALEHFIGEHIVSQSRSVILQNDLVALCAAAIDRDSFSSHLNTLAAPVLMFVGDRDKRMVLAQRAAAELAGAKLVVLPQLGHATALSARTILMPYIKKFLQVE